MEVPPQLEYKDLPEPRPDVPLGTANQPAPGIPTERQINRLVTVTGIPMDRLANSNQVVGPQAGREVEHPELLQLDRIASWLLRCLFVWTGITLASTSLGVAALLGYPLPMTPEAFAALQVGLIGVTAASAFGVVYAHNREDERRQELAARVANNRRPPEVVEIELEPLQLEGGHSPRATNPTATTANGVLRRPPEGAPNHSPDTTSLNTSNAGPPH